MIELQGEQSAIPGVFTAATASLGDSRQAEG